jgi:hypothetical protein
MSECRPGCKGLSFHGSIAEGAGGEAVPALDWVLLQSLSSANPTQVKSNCKCPNDYYRPRIASYPAP